LIQIEIVMMLKGEVR